MTGTESRDFHLLENVQKDDEQPAECLQEVP